MIDHFFIQPNDFATSIVALLYLMPSDKRNFVLEWLCARDVHLKNHTEYPENLRNALVVHFVSFPKWESLLEYERIVSEIIWWRDLKDETLAEMLEG